MFFLPRASLFVLWFLFVFLVYFLLIVLVVSTSASDCLERLLFVERDVKLYSLTHSLTILAAFILPVMTVNLVFIECMQPSGFDDIKNTGCCSNS